MCSTQGWTGGIFLVFIFAIIIINVNSQQNAVKFSCEGRPSGYYADIQSGCQIYHMCDGLGRQFSYSCPNTTLFQQRMLICDHWYMVNCSKAELDYGANLLIGQREKPFVEDDVEHPYHRTPRPDLLAHPSAAEYNIIFRTGRAQQGSNKNLVGGDSDYEDNNKLTDQPAYFLPSHWSTEYYKSSTEKPLKTKPILDYKKPNQNIIVNFKSNYKATTPVYPKTAPTEVPILEEDYSLNSLKTILQPPSIKDGYPKLVKPKVNFESNYKATTPVYPKFVDQQQPLASEEAPLPPSNLAYGLSTIVEPPKQAQKIIDRKVNFNSNYRATTPVYPTFVPTAIPLAIQETAVDPNQPSLSTVIQPPKSYNENHLNTVQQPSIYYQPPITNEQIKSPKSNHEVDKKWLELRRIFLIPDYDFPLDASAIRPSYEQGPSSFQVNPFSFDLMPRQHA